MQQKSEDAMSVTFLLQQVILADSGFSFSGQV